MVEWDGEKPKRNLVPVSCWVWVLARLLGFVQPLDHTLVNAGKFSFEWLLMKYSCCWSCFWAGEKKETPGWFGIRTLRKIFGILGVSCLKEIWDQMENRL